MIYEAILSSDRVENVEAEGPDVALLLAHHKSEGSEQLRYLREKESGKVVWSFGRFMSP